MNSFTVIGQNFKQECWIHDQQTVNNLHTQNLGDIGHIPKLNLPITDDTSGVMRDITANKWFSARTV